MKAFKTKTTEEQKIAYIRSCRRWMRNEIGKLRERHRGALERADKLRHQAVQADHRAEKMQDVVANKADREFGGWDTWRHDSVLLSIVTMRMDTVAIKPRTRAADLRRKADQAVALYHVERERIVEKYNALIRTVDSSS